MINSGYLLGAPPPPKKNPEKNPKTKQRSKEKEN